MQTSKLGAHVLFILASDTAMNFIGNSNSLHCCFGVDEWDNSVFISLFTVIHIHAVFLGWELVSLTIIATRWYLG